MMNSIKVSKNTYGTSSSTYPTYAYTTPPLQSTSSPPSSYTYTTIPLQSTSTYPPPPLQSTSIYPLPPLQSSSHLNDDLFPTVKVIPELKIFLEELDAIYGEGKYTQYLEIFEKHDIRVNLISKISDEWWENKLQITSLGHILTLKEAASKYT